MHCLLFADEAWTAIESSGNKDGDLEEHVILRVLVQVSSVETAALEGAFDTVARGTVYMRVIRFFW